MKIKTYPIAGIFLTVLASNSFAASVLTFSGSISNFYQGATVTPATAQQIAHYAAEGLGIGQQLQFQILVDFSRQGQLTNEDGSITTFADVPIERNCSTCYGSSGTFYDYAELISSSVDVSNLTNSAAQKSYNLATSSYRTGMATNSHDGEIQLDDYFYMYSSGNYGNENALVYNWKPSAYEDYFFSLSLNDGTGPVQSFGYLQLLSVTQSPDPVPVPAAAWLMGSALLSLAGITRRKKQATAT